MPHGKVPFELYPNPAKVRENISLLNGSWGFSFDGKEWQSINVPYCPESVLSGINYTGFINKCYYKRTFDVQRNGCDVVLHFGAVDYLAQVFVNGKLVGTHKGGYTPFECVVTDYVTDGTNELFVEVTDNVGNICSGKQSPKEKSFGCFYTRTTGIWQSVWLEYRPKDCIVDFRFYPDYANATVQVDLTTTAKGSCNVQVYFGSKCVGKADCVVDKSASVTIDLNQKRLWTVGKGNLYYVKFTFGNDVVYGYFGLRSVEYSGYDFLLNGTKTIQKLVLNQGFYPNGVYTTDLKTMKRDIASAVQLGFNGLRLHQKVFDPRFLYLCDKMGVMVWGEFASWGIDYSNCNAYDDFATQWTEVINRDFNHPSIVLWCPLNEVWTQNGVDRDVQFIDNVYNLTKSLDSTRPCVDVSGGNHGHKTDLYDFHCYEVPQDLVKYLECLQNDKTLEMDLLYCKNDNLRYDGKLPVNLSECGGFALLDKLSQTSVSTVNNDAVTAEDSWGYGNQETDRKVFVNRYKELLNVIYGCTMLSGFCYTQLYDIEQEQNGFFRYDRTPKLNVWQTKQIRKINNKK